MPFLQVNLVLNKATSKSCIPENATIPPHVNSKREIIKTSHVQIFFLLYWKESEKEVIYRKKWGSLCIQQEVYTQ